MVESEVKASTSSTVEYAVYVVICYMSITCICLLYVVICYMSVICYISVICLVLVTSSGSIGSVWISIWDVKLQAGGVVRVRLYVIYAHLCNHIRLESGWGDLGHSSVHR